MKAFADSGWFLALHNKKDIHHKEALSILKKIPQEKIIVCTSDYIVDEAVTLALARTNSPEIAEALGDGIMNSKHIKILKVNEDNFRDAWIFFKEHKWNYYSFTDCTTFVLMREHSIRRAFTYDEHFRREGFEINLQVNL